MFGRKKEENPYEMVKLKTVVGVYEKTMLTGLLDEHEIPYIAQGNGIGGYMTLLTGTSGSFGTDILVGSNYLEKARELMDSIDWEALAQDTEIPEEEWNTGKLPEE